MDISEDADSISPTIEGADDARIVVNAYRKDLGVTGFVANGDLIQSVNIVDPAPYDEEKILAGVQATLAVLAEHAVGRPASRRADRRWLMRHSVVSRRPPRQGGSVDSIERIVIIGGGLAAANAVETLRQEGFTGTVTVIGKEPHLPYERPPLSKSYLMGKKTADDLPPHDATWYEAHDVTVLTSTEATAIDSVARTVQPRLRRRGGVRRPADRDRGRAPGP